MGYLDEALDSMVRCFRQQRIFPQGLSWEGANLSSLLLTGSSNTYWHLEMKIVLPEYECQARSF